MSEKNKGLDTTSYLMGKKSGGSGGTTNYNELSNKPQINSVELSGNKSLSDLGIGSVDVFYEEATYENPFIFSGKKKGIYFLKYDDERAYAKFNASSSSAINLATILDTRINGIMCNMIEIYKDIPDDIPNNEAFAVYIGYTHNKNYFEGPFQRVFVSRRSGSNNGLDFSTGDIAAYDNIQTVYNKTTSINSNSNDTQYPSAKAVWDLPTTYSGYDATKTQVLKNINGTLTWVDE